MTNSPHLSMPRLSALNAARTPQIISTLTRTCVIVFLATPIALLLTPWQQNIRATGKVTAFTPIERQQTIEAPVYGRITRWYVREGSRVKEGDVLVEISDVDTEYFSRLKQQRDAAAQKLTAKEEELQAYQTQVTNLQTTQTLQISTAQYRVDVARQRVSAAQEKLIASQASLETAIFQSERYQRLYAGGLVSKRDLEVALRDKIVAERSVNGDKAALSGAVAEQHAAEAEIGRVRSDAQARVNSAVATMNKSQSELQDSKGSLLKLDVDLSRQNNQVVKAPRDGTVFRLLANPQGDVVKQSDPLLILVPDASVKAVELWLKGNDVTLITPGRNARLQFEGWPALQFAGWPEVAVGTFSGTVSLVDATDDGKGKFRVVIVPDEVNGKPWPTERFLRQGVRVEGWILLNRVTLAYELWRQLNAFPPIISPDPKSDNDVGQETAGKKK